MFLLANAVKWRCNATTKSGGRCYHIQDHRLGYSKRLPSGEETVQNSDNVQCDQCHAWRSPISWELDANEKVLGFSNGEAVRAHPQSNDQGYFPPESADEEQQRIKVLVENKKARKQAAAQSSGLSGEHLISRPRPDNPDARAMPPPSGITNMNKGDCPAPGHSHGTSHSHSRRQDSSSSSSTQQRGSESSSNRRGASMTDAMYRPPPTPAAPQLYQQPAQSYGYGQQQSQGSTYGSYNQQPAQQYQPAYFNQQPPQAYQSSYTGQPAPTFMQEPESYEQSAPRASTTAATEPLRRVSSIHDLLHHDSPEQPQPQPQPQPKESRTRTGSGPSTHRASGSGTRHNTNSGHTSSSSRHHITRAESKDPKHRSSSKDHHGPSGKGKGKEK